MIPGVIQGKRGDYIGGVAHENHTHRHRSQVCCGILINSLAQSLEFGFHDRFETKDVARLEERIHCFTTQAMEVMMYCPKASLAGAKLCCVELMLISDASV